MRTARKLLLLPHYYCINSVDFLCVLTLIIVSLQIAVQRFAFFKMRIAFQKSSIAFSKTRIANLKEGLQNSKGVCKRVVMSSF